MHLLQHNITPMHVAAKWGKIKMVNLLMSKGANIEAKTRDGLTPLHCAARSGHHEVVDILIEKGAPIGSKTKVIREAKQAERTGFALRGRQTPRRVSSRSLFTTLGFR